MDGWTDVLYEGRKEKRLYSMKGGGRERNREGERDRDREKEVWFV